MFAVEISVCKALALRFQGCSHSERVSRGRAEGAVRGVRLTLRFVRWRTVGAGILLPKRGNVNFHGITT